MDENEYPGIVQDVIEDQIYMLTATLLDAGMPFRLILTPEDNWDRPLPDDILENSRHALVLDIEGQSLDDSYYNIDSDAIYIVTGFDGEAYYRTIDSYDILGIIDLESNTPIMIKPFDSTRPSIEDYSVQEIDESSEAYIRSYEALKAHNPHLFEK